ncbi:MAG TPA: histidine--tRNA ligase [Thermoprotei archaeon]|nr:histidine--tRNA ligase [TACK group archaeon]HEV50955.1 histidine--tRNA ligase [Thermoprotei archaeon]
MNFELVRGMRDVIGAEARSQRKFEETSSLILDRFGYQEVKLPSIEYYDLLAAKAGEELLDSLYEFEDRGGRKVALTPELTASAARLYVMKFRDLPKPVKIWYIGPCFRYDEPQRGRYRQFTQLGIEVYGSSSPLADAEVAYLSLRLLKAVGIKAYLKVGNISFMRSLLEESGIKGRDLNKAIREIDHGRYEEVMGLLDEDGKKMLKDMINSPDSRSDLDRWEAVAKDRFPSAYEGLRRLRQVLVMMRAMDPQLDVKIDVAFARGIAYYTDFIFEAIIPGTEGSLLGGGRYDNLVSDLGGPVTPAVGFAVGVDRVALSMAPVSEAKQVLIAAIDDQSLEKAARAFGIISNAEVHVDLLPGVVSVREALERAIKGSYHKLVIAGAREGPDHFAIRDIKAHEQVEADGASLLSQLGFDEASRS